LKQEQKFDKEGDGRMKEGMLAHKPLDFQKPVRPRMWLLIGAAWSS